MKASLRKPDSKESRVQFSTFSSVWHLSCWKHRAPVHTGHTGCGTSCRDPGSSVLLGVLNATKMFQHYLFSDHSDIDAFLCMFSVCDLFLMSFTSALAALWQPENRAVYRVPSCCSDRWNQPETAGFLVRSSCWMNLSTGFVTSLFQLERYQKFPHLQKSHTSAFLETQKRTRCHWFQSLSCISQGLATPAFRR